MQAGLTADVGLTPVYFGERLDLRQVQPHIQRPSYKQNAVLNTSGSSGIVFVPFFNQVHL